MAQAKIRKCFEFDENLTWAEKGIYSWLQMNAKNGVVITTIRELERYSASGSTATQNTLNRLIKKGYVKREQDRDDGCYGCMKYILLDKNVKYVMWEG